MYQTYKTTKGNIISTTLFKPNSNEEPTHMQFRNMISDLTNGERVILENDKRVIKKYIEDNL